MHPNALALARWKDEQVRKDSVQARIVDPTVAEVGAEFSGKTLTGRRALGPSVPLQADVVQAEAPLPSAVDNSVETWFPPITSQGALGDCAAYSTTYYTMTSQVARLRGFNVKSDSAGAHKFSTRFTYNQINGGSDSGSWITTSYAIMLKNGCPSLQSWPYTSDCVSWPTSAAIWREALDYRMASSGYIVSLDTDVGLANTKQMLADGYVLNFATDISMWQFTTLKNDPGTSADDGIFASGVPTTRQIVCSYADTTGGKSGHGMTLVGYNDDVWIDLNNNGVVDPGEKGAFRVANSWGTRWKDGGYVWIAYDALKATSAVAGGPNPSTRVAAFWSNRAYWISARASYSPTLVAELTLSTAARNQLSLSLGRGATAATTPKSTWSPASFQKMGGALAFDGTTTAGQGTFVFDCTDLVNTGTGDRWFASLTDNASGNATTFTSLRFIDNSNAVTACQGTNPAGGLPLPVDNTTVRAYADNALNTAAAPTITTQPQSLTVAPGSTGTFSVVASGGAPLGYQWQRNGSAIGGATSASYTTPITNSADSGSLFTVIVSNGSGSATSSPAILTVKSLDFNADRAVDVLDLATLAGAYGTRQVTCDLNGDGTVNDADITLWLAGF